MNFVFQSAYNNKTNDISLWIEVICLRYQWKITTSADITCNYEGIRGMASKDSEHKGFQTFESQTTVKKFFVLFVNLISVKSK